MRETFCAESPSIPYITVDVTLWDVFGVTYFVPATASLDSERLARLFVNNIFRLHGMPKSIVSDRDSRIMSLFWKSVFEILGTKLLYSSAYHPQTDGHTERDFLR